MIPFFLGIITGMILLTSSLILIYLVLEKNKARVNRVVKQIQTLGKTRGIMIEPENPELSNWIDSLKEK